MDQINDQLLTKLSVRLVNIESQQAVGSGILCYHPTFNNYVYVLTAGHCLFEDKDSFEKPYNEVELHFFNPTTNCYGSVIHTVDFRFVSTDIDNDVAVLVLNLAGVESITGKIPVVNLVSDRNAHTNFVAKGFPSATDGEEIVFINPVWVQELPGTTRFQLRINQDFSDVSSSEYRVDGFSGAGVFLYDDQQIFLFGIFTQFLDPGKVLYCEPLIKFNNLLSANYLPPFVYTFFGSHGISFDFFRLNCEKSIRQLGPRFNAKLNFRLPIAYNFSAISRDSIFKQNLAGIVDKHLSSSINNTGGIAIAEIVDQYNQFNRQIKEWYFSISWRMDQEIVLDDIYTAIRLFEENSEKLLAELYEKRREAYEVGDIENDSEPYAGEISSVNIMRRNLLSFKRSLDESQITLANNPVLFVKGVAGSGKSHLLGDVVSKRVSDGLPTVLLLGQLFIQGKSVWESISDQLGVNCNKEEFLLALNSIGKQVGTRVLVMIDAINEGAGKILWRDSIVGLMHDFSLFPYVGLVFSIRSTYWQSVIPEVIREDEFISKIEHQGFRGQEYEAVKLFCEFYNINQPNFPLLNPEYSNPLFLHLICRGIRESSQKEFPQGFQGVSKIFDYYITAIKNKLVIKRDEYDYAPKLVTDVLNTFSKACFEKDRRYLSLSESISLLKENFSDYPRLLGDLIEESVLIRTFPNSNCYAEETEEEEVVYFAYERFGDFYVANDLINEVSDVKEVFRLFEEGQKLGRLLESGWNHNYGVLEAFAIILPERFDIEIFEVLSWAFKDENGNASYWGQSISHWYLNSLKWRTIESIDDAKFIHWVQSSGDFDLSDDEYFNFLYEICAVEGHPFNSDRIDRILFSESMARRDSFLQEFLLYYGGKDGGGTATPLRRLIEWAWRPNISREIPKETARLVAQALSWVLGTTNTALRDQATKAMVNLLQDQFPALIEVFEKHIEIDDTYITERICAVAYGCALRTKSDENLKGLAQSVYRRIFQNGSPPAHLLLRDYCRHIIELALSRGISLIITNQNFRPPYNAKLPDEYPTKEDLKIYKADDETDGGKSLAAQGNGKIIFSVLSWDFGRYIVDSALRNFEPIQFTFESEIEIFRKSLPRGSKSVFRTLREFYHLYATPEEKRKRLQYLSDEQKLEYWNAVDDTWERVQEKLMEKLNDEQVTFYYDKILPYWELIVKVKSDRDFKLDSSAIKAWIVKRVFELGYNGNIHGSYDSRFESFSRSEDSRIERIGKKYQWIAYYEVLGTLADNYRICDRYSTKKKSWIYDGPWDLTYRDIDPSFTVVKKQKEFKENEFGILMDDFDWFAPPRYLHWSNLREDWSTTTADLPNYKECLTRVDPNGEEWVYLYSSHTWKAPKVVGNAKFMHDGKEIWFHFQSFLVPRSKLMRTVDWLDKQELHGGRLPQAYDVDSLLIRERYWSPLSKKYDKEHGVWRTFENSNLRVMLPVVEAVGSLDKDNSGAHFRFKMPCKKIFETLELEYARDDGEFQDSTGDIIFSNISPAGCLIRKRALTKFLNENDLDIVWTLVGEKNAFFDMDLDSDIRKSLSGVFSLVDDEVKINSKIKISDW